MKCFEEAAIVFAFASATRKAGPKHRERMRPVFLVHPCRHGFWSPTQSESYESCLISAWESGGLCDVRGAMLRLAGMRTSHKPD